MLQTSFCGTRPEAAAAWLRKTDPQFRKKGCFRQAKAMVITMSIRFPTFTSSDRELDITYRYRCELYARHVKETPVGHVISEFLPDVPWAGIYNTISCAASHHFREGRWMQDPTPLHEYAAFWCTAGNPRLYSFPLSDSVLALANVTGDRSLAGRLYPELARVYREWDDHKAPNGMYRQIDGYDGGEFSISGHGLRPTINSYMVADARALSEIAAEVGDEAGAARYREEADTLTRQINEKLWNPSLGTYSVVSDDGEMQNVRELLDYIPWIYGIPPAGRDACFRYLLDPACFLAPCGLRTADASHPAYMKPFQHECLWNGPVWPYGTAQTLTAVIEYLHTCENPTITPADFMTLLLQYAYSHRDEDGSPYLDENMHPDTGIWLARSILREWGRDDSERGRHYNHSTFIDLVITGLCGVIPQKGSELTIHPLGTSLDWFRLEDVPYHGHSLTVAWDRESGLAVSVDGVERAHTRPGETAAVTLTL